MKIFEIDITTLKNDEGQPLTDSMEGTVQMEIPTYKERLSLIKAHGIMNEKIDEIERADKMLDLVEKHIKAVSIRLKSGEEINSITDLGYFQEGTNLTNRLGRLLIGGVSLSDPFARR